MGIGVKFSLQQFSDVLRIRDATGTPYILIGGQAVNYWAERYLPTEAELQPLRPFTSEDIDFKGGIEDVRRIAQQLDLVPVFPPKVAMTALAGAIPFQIGTLKSNIEIVRRIPGVKGSIDDTAVSAESNGQSIRVMDPISLLACKMELAATVAQEKRQDIAHLKILVPCVRAFLNEFLQLVELGTIPAKDWLGAVNRVLKLTQGRRAQKLAEQHRIHWQDILPLPAIYGCANQKIVRFRVQQLERGWEKSGGGEIGTS